MSALYPTGIDIKTLSRNAIALKIARHSRCSECESCTGLRPPPDVLVALDSSESNQESSLGDLTQYGSDDDDKDSRYIDVCVCGHDTKSHGADEDRIGKDEYTRRARVAIRLDELLSVRLILPSLKSVFERLLLAPHAFFITRCAVPSASVLSRTT